MKQNKDKVVVAISSVALLVVLIIQVNWILQTAQVKEQLFNEKANMVLSRTTEAINADKETCKKIGECADKDGGSESATQLGTDEVHKIDSLFNHYMKFYNFHIDYSFEVVKPGSVATINENSFTNYIYNKPIEKVTSKNEVELKLIFPDKKQFIMAEMGLLFITSVVLILVVLIMFWRTVRSLVREKKIAEHTTDFLNNMTHEFKTPLTNIALAGKMIQKDFSVQQADKLKHYSDIILAENEKLRLQVEQVLSITALERGEIPLRKEELDGHKLIHDALKNISIQIESRQGHLKLNLAAGRFTVMADRTHLTNALCNVVDNAIKYSKEIPELSVQTVNSGHNLVMMISDKGVGMQKEYQKKVFDKYFRIPTGDVHDVKGFGIGLAYVKKIVELHGGTVELKSEQGTGTIFIISIPYV